MRLKSLTCAHRLKVKGKYSLMITHFFFQTWIFLVLVTLLVGLFGFLFNLIYCQFTQKLDLTKKERRDNNGPSFDSGKIKKGSKPGLRGVETFCFNMFRSIIIQGNLLPASSWSLRLFFFTWYAFCVILYGEYICCHVNLLLFYQNVFCPF